MTQKMAKIFSLGICLLFLASLIVWPEPALAGTTVWSAETIPTRINNVLGPAGVDIRDLAIGDDDLTIYAAPGDSITDITIGNVIYKSIDGGVTWTALNTPIRTDLIAVAPDDKNLVAIGNNTTLDVRISADGGLTWHTTGTIQESPGGAPAEAIYDLAISPIRNFIHYVTVAGKEVGDLANLWYFNFGAVLFPAWYETNNPAKGFDTANETATLAFSPHFSTDGTVVAVTDKESENVSVQVLYIDTKTWNSMAGYTDYPYMIVHDSGIKRLTSASIALSPYYFGTDATTYKMFIGLTVDGSGTAPAKSGIYRIADTFLQNILLNTKIHSLVFDGIHLVGGSDNTTTVYLCIFPYAVTPSIYNSYVTKSPSGDDRVVVAWLGNDIVAGTSGDESAFAISGDNGLTFDDLSLIDTAISKAKDVAVSREGDKVYLVSENVTNTSTSVWLMEGGWRRVLSARGRTNFIIRMSPADSSVIYLGQRGSPNILYNDNSGMSSWSLRTSNINIQDIAVESSQVIYVIDARGVVSKNINSSAIWNTTSITYLNSGSTIVSVNTNIVLAGSQDGYVAYTFDGGSTWTEITQQLEPGAGNIQLVADKNFGDNKILYAASDTPGTHIMKWVIGTSTAWTNIISSVILGGVYGLATTTDVLYALEYDAGGQSTLWRHSSPSTIQPLSTEWTSSSTNATTDTNDLTVALNAAPQALKASKDKLWAVKTNGTNKLYSYYDVIINIQITLVFPPDGYRDAVNFKTSLAYDIPFNWTRPSVATGYELTIARDEGFADKAATIIVNTEEELIHIIVGPDQIGPTRLNFTPGGTFYWRVRVITPSYSSYSEIRYFTIDPSHAMVPLILTLIKGEITEPADPVFAWNPLAETTEYEFRLDDNLPMTSPIIDTYVDKSSIATNITLKYDVTYFWQVRATKPVRSDWSEIGTFYIIERPVNETAGLVIKEVAPQTLTAPVVAPTATEIKFSFGTTFVTPGYLTVFFLILIFLLGVVIFLIYRQKPIVLPVLAIRRQQPPAPPPKIKPHGEEAARPQVTPEPRAETPIKPAEPEKAQPHPTLIEKDKEGATVIFGAKSFLWMTTQVKITEEGQAGLSDKERQSLGKRMATRIHDLAKKENLYLKYPQDAPMLLSIWAQYGSRNETNNYLIKSFELVPYNAIKLLKTYMPAAQPGREPTPAEDFTLAQYDNIGRVIDTDNIYAALSKVFKFRADAIEERVPVAPADRDLASQFMRLHYEAKDRN
jgi:hypothetical protein